MTTPTPDNAARPTVKRYIATVDVVAGVWRCAESATGGWISYDDHAATVTALEAEVACQSVKLAGHAERTQLILAAKDQWMSRAKKAERLVTELTLALRFAERHCPCGARPESPDTHPHMPGCLIASALTGAGAK